MPSFFGALLSSAILILTACSHSSPPPAPKEVSRAVAPMPLDLSPSQSSGQFVDKTADYGLDGLRATSLYAVDLNGDAHSDLVLLPDFFSNPQFFLYRPDLKKFEKISYNPFAETYLASYLIFNDINKDGMVDLFLGVFNQEDKGLDLPTRFFWGEFKDGQIFFREDAKVFPHRATPSPGLSLLDFDLDGDLDLFQPNWAGGKSSSITEEQMDRLFEQRQDELGKVSFIDVTPLLRGENNFSLSEKIYLNTRPTFSSSTCDLDRNGYPDILTTSTHGYGNKLWLNTRDSTGARAFINQAKESHFEADETGKMLTKGGGHGLFANCSDYNHDLHYDLFLGNLYHQYDLESVDRSAILEATAQAEVSYVRNELNAEGESERWDRADKRALWVDLDMDGEKDLLVAGSGYPPSTRMLYFHQVLGQFTEEAKKFGLNLINPSGSILIDVNGDGRMDLLTGQSNQRSPQSTARLYLFENQTPWSGQRSLQVYLRGKKSNPQGIGASVVLRTHLRKKIEYAEWSQGGPPSQNEALLYFVLDKNERARSLEVTWPFKDKKGQATTVHYDLTRFKFSQANVLTLCENGQIYLGKEVRTTCTN